MAANANSAYGSGSGNGNGGALPPPKTIRFVQNNGGVPPQKRRRVNAACLTCRKRKTRCAGEHPTCSTCAKNGQSCLGYSDILERKKEFTPGRSNGPLELEDAETLGAEDDDEHERQYCKMVMGTGVGDQKSLPKLTTDLVHMSPREDNPVQAPPSVNDHEWDGRQEKSRIQAENAASPSIGHRSDSFSTQDNSNNSGPRSLVQRHTESHRVPYFRYFGPTAIVPGFKQMVVKVRDRRHSSNTATPTSTASAFPGLSHASSTNCNAESADELPIYDPGNPAPVHDIILSLVQTFFEHFGNNYPFLRREKFPRLVREKRVEPILVDAVCALAARFSNLSVFTKCNDPHSSRADNGNVFAQRAKSATVDTFPCPTVAAVQACLLMAYEGFGADQDSALWMYLGLAIRMAVDLGLHTKKGVKFQGEKDPWYTPAYGHDNSESQQLQGEKITLSPEEQNELEQERIDTMWAVFILDRIISSGTGRSVTLRDDDFGLSLPCSSLDSRTGWPDPFPNLVQIIHLYGRASDVLNKIHTPEDLTPERRNSFISLEQELRKLPMHQDARLRFDPTNFEKYVKSGHGTVFILLHFWFHALIIVLHQPTLLAGLQKMGPMLVPHSRELSMSSAKTIADMIAFAKLIDERSIIGNPFTVQPIYIAACAFVTESVATSPQHPTSSHPTPPPESTAHRVPMAKSNVESGAKPSMHFLLASAANQNYQACHNALKHLHMFWGGVRYIVTAVDQKAKGIWDCETYTIEEYESTKTPRRPSSHSLTPFKEQIMTSPPMPPLAWSLTGTTNSPNSSLTLFYQNPVAHGGHVSNNYTSQLPSPAPVPVPTPPGNMIYDPIRQSLPQTSPMLPPAYPQPNTSALRHSVTSQGRRVSNTSSPGRPLSRYGGLITEEGIKSPVSSNSNFKMTLSPSQAQVSRTVSSNFSPPSQHSMVFEHPTYPTAHESPISALSDIRSPSTHSQSNSHAGSVVPSGQHQNPGVFTDLPPPHFNPGALIPGTYSYSGPTVQGMHLVTFNNETDIGQHLASFEHTDMMSWFGDYFPTDVLGFYEHTESSIA